MDALFKGVAEKSPQLVRGFFDTTEDMKGGKNDVTEEKASHWTVVTGSQEGGW